MKRRGIAAAVGAGAVGLALVPAAAAHHGPPECRYGKNVLPEAVTVEYYRMFENCSGLRVTVETTDGQRLVVSHGRDDEAKQPKGAKRSKKCRRAKRSRKCR